MSRIQWKERGMTMVDGYGGQHDFTNQYLPQEERFQSGWREFPNFLKTENGEEKRDHFGEEITKAGNYLPFTSSDKVAFMTEDKQKPTTVEQYFPSFKEQSERRRHTQDWRSFLEEKPVRRRFVPTEVPSILKGMPRRDSKVQEEVDYQQLEEELLITASEMMIFVEDETTTLEDVSTLNKTPQKPTNLQSFTTTSYQPALLSHSQEIVQETAIQQLPKTQKNKQRKAMKKSLSMIMEQEKGTQTLPYSY